MKEKFKEIFAGFQTAYGQYQKGERGKIFVLTAEDGGKQKLGLLGVEISDLL